MLKYWRDTNGIHYSLNICKVGVMHAWKKKSNNINIFQKEVVESFTILMCTLFCCYGKHDWIRIIEGLTSTVIVQTQRKKNNRKLVGREKINWNTSSAMLAYLFQSPICNKKKEKKNCYLQFKIFVLYFHKCIIYSKYKKFGM